MISSIQIYGLFDPLTDELRYVGMTSQTLHKRLTKHISESKQNLFKKHKDNWIRSLLNKNTRPEIACLQFTNENDYEVDEQWNIAYFRSIGCRLTNLTAGGEGTLNPSQETRNKIVQLRKNESKETREKRRNSLMGHVLTQETKDKISKSHIGKVVSEESRQKMSAAGKGRVVSKETRLKISKAQKGRIGQPAWNKGLNKNNNPIIAKYSELLKGKKRNPESMKALGIKNRKISDIQLLEIREKYSTGIKQIELSKMYSVGAALICLLLNNKSRTKSKE